MCTQGKSPNECFSPFFPIRITKDKIMSILTYPLTKLFDPYDLNFKKTDLSSWQGSLEDKSDIELRAMSGVTLEQILLEHSMEINLYLRCNRPKLDELIEKIVKDAKSSGAPHIGRIGTISKHLNMLLSNILVVHHEHAGFFISYSRTTNQYTQNRYRNSGIGIKPLKSAIAILESLELIESHVGQQRPQHKERGILSRLRGMPALFDMFTAKEFEETVSSLLEKPKSIDPIRLKNKKGDLIEYEDNATTNSMRKSINKYNEFLSWSGISLSHLGEDQAGNEGFEIDTSRKQVYRTFNSTFERGGRFYGGWWQDVPSHLRPFIVINGEPTVELDFGSMIAHQAYSNCGLSYWDHHNDTDPYEVPDTALPRKLKKHAFTRLMACRSKGGAIGSLLRTIESETEFSEYRSLTRRDISDLIQKVIQKHTLIADQFFAMSPLEYQYQDARVCEAIITACVEEEIPVLTIHDSFIVPQENEDRLRAIMTAAFRNEVGNSVPDIK